MNGKLIPFKFHPRVFNSLGADLVTDDIVALIELVKNSYDAGADKVNISFFNDENEKLTLEICDNGCGMTREVIKDVWFTVATPFKENNKSIIIDNTKRKVSGEKGLGRLSTARLGELLEVYTKTKNDGCWKITLNWSEITDSNTAGGIIEKSTFPYPNYDSGTTSRIKSLYEDWLEN